MFYPDLEEFNKCDFVLEQWSMLSELAKTIEYRDTFWEA